ncbi:hypothetical protein V8C86DRAFT_2679471 [Haematococcus lacustris]
MRPVLYLSNLPYGAAESHIEDWIATHAKVEVHSVELLKRGQKGSLRTCGLGTVVLKEGADAAALMQLLDGKDIMGRAVIVRRDKFVEDQASYTHPTAVETS